jgi:hypothetical protein
VSVRNAAQRPARFLPTPSRLSCHRVVANAAQTPELTGGITAKVASVISRAGYIMGAWHRPVMAGSLESSFQTLEFSFPAPMRKTLTGDAAENLGRKKASH